MKDMFEAMTVADLRKYAKEHGVKLPAGIDKKGIIEKLCNETETAPQQTVIETPASAAPTVRRASIISDDEDDEDSYDNPPPYTPAPVFRTPAAQQKQKAAAPHPAGSSLSTISSKAPAFTMDGARAWHNPRSFSPTPPPQTYNRTQWSTKPAYQQPAAAPAHSAPQRTESPAAAPVAPQADGRTFQTIRTVRDSFSPAGELDREIARQTEFAQLARVNEPKPEPVEVPPLTPEALMNVACEDVEGILDITEEGYGYLRTENFLPGKKDIYIAYAQVKRFSLKKGDLICGKAREKRENETYRSMLYITAINGTPVDDMPVRTAFEDLTAIYPRKKISFAAKDGIPAAVRMLDLFSPIGYGQRALISVPDPAAGTALLKDLDTALSICDSSARILYLSADQAPEDITELKQTLSAVPCTTGCGDPMESTVKMCELVAEHAMRMAEQKKNIIILVDDLNKLAAAFNACAPQNSRTLPGGLCGFALNGIKKLFGTARNIKEGGSVSVIALVEADSALAGDLSASANMLAAMDADCIRNKTAPALLLSACQTKRVELLNVKTDAECREKLQAFTQRFNNA